MLVNINGNEALSEGLRRAGTVKIFEPFREPELTAAEAIGKGSFFASKAIKCACIIDENDVQEIEEAYERRKMHNASLVVIVVGREINYRILHKLYAYNAPMWYAYSPESLYEELRDASIYSEIVKKPAVIFVPRDVLRQREQVNINGTVMFYNYTKAGVQEREEKKTEIEKRYNALPAEAAGYVVIAEYRSAQIAREIIGKAKGVKVIGIDMFYPVRAEKMKKELKERKVLILGKGGGFLEEILTLSHCLPSDVIRSQEEIREALNLFLPREIRRQLRCPEPSDEMLHIRRPTLPPITDFMCEGCIYREQIEKMLKASPFLVLFEDIFCERFGIKVRSGMANAESPYMCDLVVTNRDSDTYRNLKVEKITCRCIKEEQ